jgi:hypothetical protein
MPLRRFAIRCGAKLANAPRATKPIRNSPSVFARTERYLVEVTVDVNPKAVDTDVDGVIV